MLCLQQLMLMNFPCAFSNEEINRLYQLTDSYTWGDNDIILSTVVTAAMLGVYYVATVYSVVNLRMHANCCV